MMTDIEALETLYAAVSELRLQNGERRLADAHGRQDWPTRGVYFMFEPHETRADGSPRIVRVGTHALKRHSKSTLWKRLSQHRGTLAGNGNHRGSILRKHVGKALLHEDAGTFGRDVTDTWGVGSSASRDVRAHERELERKVSEYLARFTIVWLDVPDEPGPESHRGLIERTCVALLSSAGRRCHPPSPDWLGHMADSKEIRSSGLWNVQHVGESWDEYGLEALAQHSHAA
jgi:hypothetical protein